MKQIDSNLVWWVRGNRESQGWEAGRGEDMKVLDIWKELAFVWGHWRATAGS